MEYIGIVYVFEGLAIGRKLWQHGPRYSFDNTVPFKNRWTMGNKFSFVFYLCAALSVFVTPYILYGILQVGKYLFELDGGHMFTQIMVIAIALISAFQTVVIEWTLYGYCLAAVAAVVKILYEKKIK